MSSTKLFTVTPATMVRSVRMPAQMYSAPHGLEERFEVWRTRQFGFELRWPQLDETDVTSIMNFYVEHGGPAETFLFQDPTAPDSSGQVLGLGDGVRTLFKVYGDRMASASAYINGAGGAAYTVSLDNGTLTYTTPPSSGAVITADVRSERYAVRFADQLTAEQFFWRLSRDVTVTLVQPKVIR